MPEYVINTPRAPVAPPSYEYNSMPRNVPPPYSEPIPAAGMPPAKAAKKISKAKIILFSSLASAIVVAVIVLVVVFAFPPTLSDEKIFDDINLKSSEDNLRLTESMWGKNDEYQAVSKEIVAIEDFTADEEKGKAAIVCVGGENESFRISTTWQMVYYLKDGNWKLYDIEKWVDNIEPLGGVDDEKVIDSSLSLLKAVDENPPYSDKGTKQYLAKKSSSKFWKIKLPKQGEQ
jgi:hypothetical protein